MPHHIVIVEDEPVTRRDYNLTSLRRGIPFPLRRAVPGWEIMQNQPVDLILLDINCPMKMA